MPQVTVYIREDDIDAWKSVVKKSEFIHNALQGVSFKVESRGASDYTITKVPPQESLRSTTEILADIEQLKKQRDEELEWIQDNRELVRIGKEYEAQIQACWDEYHLVKGDKK